MQFSNDWQKKLESSFSWARALDSVDLNFDLTKTLPRQYNGTRPPLNAQPFAKNLYQGRPIRWLCLINRTRAASEDFGSAGSPRCCTPRTLFVTLTSIFLWETQLFRHNLAYAITRAYLIYLTPSFQKWSNAWWIHANNTARFYYDAVCENPRTGTVPSDYQDPKGSLTEPHAWVPPQFFQVQGCVLPPFVWTVEGTWASATSHMDHCSTGKTMGLSVSASTWCPMRTVLTVSVYGSKLFLGKWNVLVLIVASAVRWCLWWFQAIDYPNAISCHRYIYSPLSVKRSLSRELQRVGKLLNKWFRGQFVYWKGLPAVPVVLGKITKATIETINFYLADVPTPFCSRKGLPLWIKRRLADSLTWFMLLQDDDGMLQEEDDKGKCMCFAGPAVRIALVDFILIWSWVIKSLRRDE